MNCESDAPADIVADLHYRGPAIAARLSVLRRQLATWARRVGLPAADADGMALASYEAMANVVAHAYGDEIGMLDVRATCPPDQDTVTVTVTDNGRWQPPPAEPGILRGRGLPLIRSLSHTADIVPTPHGTTVHMHWSLPTPGCPSRT
jgi:serine/threonine-protein kinase RsbW